MRPVVRYSGSIMNEPSKLLPLDPIGLTRQLCEIESTTYHEGAVGDFLAEFLAGRGWEVEKTAVAQPADSQTDGPRWNVYGGQAGQRPDLVFSTHMDTVPPYIPVQRGHGVDVWARSVGREGNTCGTGCGG
jgi:acetylornithine deacetylase